MQFFMREMSRLKQAKCTLCNELDTIGGIFIEKFSGHLLHLSTLKTATDMAQLVPQHPHTEEKNTGVHRLLRFNHIFNSGVNRNVINRTHSGLEAMLCIWWGGVC